MLIALHMSIYGQHLFSTLPPSLPSLPHPPSIRRARSRPVRDHDRISMRPPCLQIVQPPTAGTPFPGTLNQQLHHTQNPSQGVLLPHRSSEPIIDPCRVPTNRSRVSKGDVVGLQELVPVAVGCCEAVLDQSGECCGIHLTSAGVDGVEEVPERRGGKEGGGGM